MENFVLYEEVGRGKHSIVYKGRRKETINFVAIHCVDKCKRPEVTNLVRLTHEIQHENIVKFHEWYETSNHLWLVVELCTGGNLATVIEQDQHLPESSVRKFGIDLVKGLHHIHSLGIVFSDIKPSKVLLDGPGILKFADFGLSRVEGENLDEVFEQFTDAGEQWASKDQSEILENVPNKYKTVGTPTYLAPEILQGSEHTIQSDLWALGCLLYEMFTGRAPFIGDTFQQLLDSIVSHDLPPPKVKGTRVSAKASPEFLSLLTGLLRKSSEERLDWAGLVTHSFWQGSLQHLAKDLETNEAIVSIRESVRQSIANFSIRASSQCGGDLPKGNSVLGQVHEVTIDTQRQETPAAGIDTLDMPDGADATLSMASSRPRTAPGHADSKVAFTISSRPHTAAAQDEDGLLGSAQLMTQSPLNAKEIIRRVRQLESEEKASDTVRLIYHSSDFTMSPIVDNSKINKPAPMKFDPKTLQVPAHSAEKVLSLSSVEVERHVENLREALENGESTGKAGGGAGGAGGAQKRLHLMHYTATLAVSSPVLANLMIQRQFLSTLAKLTKETTSVDTKAKLCRVLGIIANSATEVEETINLAEVLGVLTEQLRDNSRSGRVKAALLPGLGELLYLVATQEQAKGHGVEAWAVPPMTYTMLTRCLREGEDPVVNHLAAKIVENVSTTTSVHTQKLSVVEVGLLLWYVFSHATGDAVRITALSALCRLSKHSSVVFQSVIEKVGLPKMLAALSLPVTRIQQSVLTMFAALITSDARLTRLVQDKEFTSQILRLLESPSVVIRAKAFLVILELIRNNREILLTCCQNRLVMYIERDWRRQAPGKLENQQAHCDYLVSCMDLLINALVQMLPDITREVLLALESVGGRKHPSTIQIKQLKSSLPMMPVLQHFITSQVFRPRVVTREFMGTMSQLISHVKAIDAGSTHIQAATGAAGTEEFIHSVFSVIESLAQHSAILEEFHAEISEQLLPHLAALVSSSNGDTRALALRLFSEMAVMFLNSDQVDPVTHTATTRKLHQLIAEAVLPQFEQLLLESDPLPYYALKLLLALVEQNPSFIKELEKLNLVPVIFQVLLDHHSNAISTTMQQIAGVLNVLVTHKDSNMKELYEQGLVDHVMTLLTDVATICLSGEANVDMKAPNAMLMSLLDTLHAIFKFVSDVVRKALQAKKGGGDQSSKEAEMAESLLLANKPFTELTSHLTQLLCHEDSDLAELALKCLSLLVQLFGGDHANAMSPENMKCYSIALANADAKRQKIILRIIKRMISTEKSHCDMMKQHGVDLVTAIRNLAQTASSTAEVALTTLASEILKATGT